MIKQKTKPFGRAGRYLSCYKYLLSFQKDPGLVSAPTWWITFQFQKIPPFLMFEGTYKIHIHTCKQNIHTVTLKKIHENQWKHNQTQPYSHVGEMAVFLFKNFILISPVAGTMSCKQRIKRCFCKKT